MSDEGYKKLSVEMERRGGRYPGKDIPEFYDLVEELFTPEEAAIAASMTSKMSTAETIAKEWENRQKMSRRFSKGCVTNPYACPSTGTENASILPSRLFLEFSSSNSPEGNSRKRTAGSPVLSMLTKRHLIG